MKRLQLLTIFLMLSVLSFGQNQSVGGVNPAISVPIPQQFGGQEIFRFQPGLVTQLGAGSTGFGFNEKWFSIGELNTGSQMVYGLRFQLPNRALTFGYQDTSDNNPRIQWIGEGQGLGNLEFRVADSFGSTSSSIVATMLSNGATFFSEQPLTAPFIFPESKVEIGSVDRKYGLLSSNSNTSLSESFGVFGLAAGSNANFSVAGRATGSGNFDVGVYGLGGGPSFAGFFDGNLSYTGGFFQSSDEKLKEKVSEIELALQDLMKLRPTTYEYIKSNKINLAEGKQFGFIAQELEEVFPELIKNIKKPVLNDANEVTEYLEYKSVNYLGLIAILTASIQELAEEVERLKETNESYVVYSDRLDQEEMDRLRKLAYKLEQNYPNPFQGRTSIEYSIPDDEKNASIMVFNMTGKLLKEFKLREKSGKIEITSDEFQPGIYLYSLISDNNEIITKKMIVK